MSYCPKIISSPSDTALLELCRQLAELANDRPAGQWPAESLQLCAEYGVFEWFVGKPFGGQGWTAEDIAKGYLQLGAACLTTTFIITQRTAATRRLEASDNELLKQELLPALCRGDLSTTVGISHLTTSRQHTRPALAAEETDGGFLVNGFSPWVTGSLHASCILMGATLADERQILFMIEGDQVKANPPHQLIALTGSCTGSVKVENVFVPAKNLVVGPKHQVLKAASGVMPGGSQTSALAIALTNAAVNFVEQQVEKRPELRATAKELRNQVAALESQLLDIARGTGSCSTQELRIQANSLVLRATQSALVAAKGTGFVAGHPVGRWCQEAMFFLVWSCPQPVLEANLCELVGVEI